MALQISPGNQARIAELLEHGDYHDDDDDDDVVAVERALDLLNEVERLNYLKSLLAVSAEQAAKG